MLCQAFNKLQMWTSIEFTLANYVWILHFKISKFETTVNQLIFAATNFRVFPMIGIFAEINFRDFVLFVHGNLLVSKLFAAKNFRGCKAPTNLAKVSSTRKLIGLQYKNLNFIKGERWENLIRPRVRFQVYDEALPDGRWSRNLTRECTILLLHIVFSTMNFFNTS